MQPCGVPLRERAADAYILLANYGRHNRFFLFSQQGKLSRRPRVLLLFSFYQADASTILLATGLTISQKLFSFPDFFPNSFSFHFTLLGFRKCESVKGLLPYMYMIPYVPPTKYH